MPLFQRQWPLLLVALSLTGILLLTLLPYGGNLSALFHFDRTMDTEHPAPPGFVVLEIPGYDGMQYYEIARTLPRLFSSEGWSILGSMELRAYAYQRILLPVVAFLLSLGTVTLLPFAFLAINVGALLGTAWVILRWKPEGYLYALALSLSPAALIALHFNLAEPLTLLLLTIFLLRFHKQSCHTAINGSMAGLDVLLLSLLVLSREVNVLFIGLLLAWTIARRQWKQSALLLVPLAVFALWHGLLFTIFEATPFLTSSAKRTVPFQAIVDIFAGTQGFNRLTLSSMSLFLGFVLPALLWISARSIRQRRLEFLALGSLAFLALMTTMAPDIWGSITSIGRAITPVYPLTILYAAMHDTFPARAIAGAVLLLGLLIGLALALTVHPFRIS